MSLVYPEMVEYTLQSCLFLVLELARILPRNSFVLSLGGMSPYCVHNFYHAFSDTQWSTAACQTTLCGKHCATVVSNLSAQSKDSRIIPGAGTRGTGVGP